MNGVTPQKKTGDFEFTQMTQCDRTDHMVEDGG